MNKAKHLLGAAVVILVSTPLLAQQPQEQPQAQPSANLLKFVTKGKKLFEGYAEPPPPLPTGPAATTTYVASRIYILPKISVLTSQFNIEDSDGNWLKSITSSTKDAYAEVYFSLDPNMPDLQGKYEVFRTLFNLPEPSELPPTPARIIAVRNENGSVSWAFNIPASDPQKIATPEEQHFMNRCRELNGLISTYNVFAQHYQFQSVAPKGLKVELLATGHTVGSYVTDPATITQTNAQFSITYSGSDLRVLRNLKNGRFTLNISFAVPLSSVQSGYSVRNLSAFNTFAASNFKKSVQNISESSGGILFADFSDRTVSEFTRAEIVNSGSSFSSSNVVVQTRDLVDPTVRTQLFNFFFPPLSPESFQVSHQRLAAQLRAESHNDIADLHDQYVAAVVGGDSKKKTDTLKAVAALAENDIAGFLSSGLAFSSDSASTRTEFHSVGQSSYTSNDIAAVSALLVNTVQERYSVSAGPFPEIGEAAKQKDNQ